MQMDHLLKDSETLEHMINLRINLEVKESIEGQDLLHQPPFPGGNYWESYGIGLLHARWGYKIIECVRMVGEEMKVLLRRLSVSNSSTFSLL